MLVFCKTVSWCPRIDDLLSRVVLPPRSKKADYKSTMSAAKYAVMYMQGIEQDQLDSSIIMLLYYRNALPRSGNSGLPVSLYVYLVSTNLVDSQSKASSSQAV